MDLQEAFDQGFVAVKTYVDDALAAQTKGLPDLIATAVKDAIAALPAPRDGVDGQDGASVTPEQVAGVVREYLDANPPAAGKDGQDGKDGADGLDGQDGAKGLDGENGADGLNGCDATDAMIDQEGNLVVLFSDGRSKSVGRVVGRDGIDGQKGDAGRDGLTLTDFDTAVSQDGRILTLSLESDEVRVTHELQLPVAIYRGGFKEGETYVQGDMVTFGGSLWHCSAETKDKPIEGRDCWQLAARKGRDGKDAKP